MRVCACSVRLDALKPTASDAPATSLHAPQARPTRLRECLNAVARELGFSGWPQALGVLGGQASRGDDMGAFWHAPRCNGLLSHGFARHEQARECLSLGAEFGPAPGCHRVLLPYGWQFVIVDDHYLRELGLGIADEAWGRAGRDLVLAFGSAAWQALCGQRLRASRSTPGGVASIV